MAPAGNSGPGMATGVLVTILLLVGAISTLSSPTSAAAVEASGSAAGTCGLKPTSDPDCSRKDLGSCGNACCAMRITFATDADMVGQKITAELAKGGPDSGYEPATTWGDFFQLNKGGCRDLRQATETTDQFLCQAIHKTVGAYHFKDTVNVKVGATKSGRTPVDFFSISNIAGALGDAGQNAKNILMLLNALRDAGLEHEVPQVTHGCGAH